MNKFDTFEVYKSSWHERDSLINFICRSNLKWEKLNDDYYNAIVVREFSDKLTDWLDDHGLKWRMI